MKPTYVLTLVSGLAVTGILLATQLGNSVAPTRGTTLSALDVSTVEIPAAAARLMADAQPGQQAERAKEVLNAVAAMSKPDLMPYVVSAMIKACPDAAPAISAAAVKALPDMAEATSVVAIEAAPSNQTDPIVAAVCQQEPKLAFVVANAAVKAAPSHSAAILETVATTVPQTRPYFVKAEANQNSATDPTTVLKQVYSSIQAAQVVDNKEANQQEVATVATKEQSSVHPLSLVPVDPITQVQSASQNAVRQVSAAQNLVQISAPSRSVGSKRPMPKFIPTHGNAFQNPNPHFPTGVITVGSGTITIPVANYHSRAYSSPTPGS